MLTRITCMYICAAVPAWVLQVSRVKSILQYSSFMYSVIIRSHLTLAVHCVSWVHLRTLCVSSWQHCWEVCYSIWWWRVSETLSISRHLLYNIFSLFLTENHAIESLCANFFSPRDSTLGSLLSKFFIVDIYVHVCEWVCVKIHHKFFIICQQFENFSSRMSVEDFRCCNINKVQTWCFRNYIQKANVISFYCKTSSIHIGDF
jgi:hypothetical protein